MVRAAEAFACLACWPHGQVPAAAALDRAVADRPGPLHVAACVPRLYTPSPAKLGIHVVETTVFLHD